MKKNMNTGWLVAGAAAAGAVCCSLVRKKKEKDRDYSGYGKTVLITGASSGIGMEFADVFASNGFDVVLTARSEEKLKSIARDIEFNYPVNADVIPADLSTAEGVDILYNTVKQRGIRIDQLVNNAGTGVFGSTVDVDTDKLSELIQLNITSVTLLCRLFGADMKQRHEGRILNVASLGAFMPDPYFNVYGPSKAYELYLTEAMSGELRSSGVSMSVLCPGPVRTGLAKKLGKAESRFALTPRDKDEIAALMDNRRTRRVQSQPLNKPSCGSVFRNPENGNAWALIDGIGYRGHACGGAQVSEKHCNFIINNGNASAEDYLQLVTEIQQKVKEKYGVDLQTEVEKFNWE